MPRAMLSRAVFAFLALPAFVAGLVPWFLLSSDRWRMRGTLFHERTIIMDVRSAFVVLCGA